MSKLAVVAFGRMSPPTVGHKRLVLKMRELANQYNGEPILFLSKSHGPNSRGSSKKNNRNPLPYSSKLRYVRDAFNDLVRVEHSDHLNFFEILVDINAMGFDEVIIVGEDYFINLPFERYNGSKYNFNSILKISSGDRNPDSNDITVSVSATQVRETVKNGDYDAFVKMVATKTETDNLWNELRNLI